MYWQSTNCLAFVEFKDSTLLQIGKRFEKVSNNERPRPLKLLLSHGLHSDLKDDKFL